MARLFVAAWPSPSVRQRLEALERVERPGWRWVDPDDWHVTLRFLGEAEPAAVADRLSAATLPQVSVRFGPGVTTLGGHAVIPVAGADPLAVAVAAATADLGEPPREEFVGHLTVARRRRSGAGDDLPSRATFSAEQRVDEVALVASELHPDGARYITLGRFGTT